MTAEPGQAEDNRNKLVYYDTNIWVAYYRGDKNEFFQSSCNALFDEMETGKVKVVASYHALSETLHTLRKKVVRAAPRGSGKDECNKLVDELTEKFTEKVNVLKAQQKIQLAPTLELDASLKDHYLYVWDKMHSIPSGSLTMNRCPDCKEHLPLDHQGPCTRCSMVVVPRVEYRYDGMGYPDLDHAYIALQHNVSALYTRDRAFEHLWDDPEFERMKIYVFHRKKGWTLS